MGLVGSGMLIMGEWSIDWGLLLVVSGVLIRDGWMIEFYDSMIG